MYNKSYQDNIQVHTGVQKKGLQRQPFVYRNLDYVDSITWNIHLFWRLIGSKLLSSAVTRRTGRCVYTCVYTDYLSLLMVISKWVFFYTAFYFRVQGIRPVAFLRPSVRYLMWDIEGGKGIEEYHRQAGEMSLKMKSQSLTVEGDGFGFSLPAGVLDTTVVKVGEDEFIMQEKEGWLVVDTNQGTFYFDKSKDTNLEFSKVLSKVRQNTKELPVVSKEEVNLIRLNVNVPEGLANGAAGETSSFRGMRMPPLVKKVFLVPEVRQWLLFSGKSAVGVSALTALYYGRKRIDYASDKEHHLNKIPYPKGEAANDNTVVDVFKSWFKL